MKPIPQDPMAQHGLLIAALCADLASGDLMRTGKTPRAARVAEIGRQMRAQHSNPMGDQR